MKPRTYDFSRGVGHTLKLQREERGVPLSKVARELSIPEATLHKLETSAYDQLDHTVYELGFVKRYAEYLGLDPELAAKKYLLERGDLPRAEQRLAKSRVKPAIVTTRLFSAAVVAVLGMAVIGYLLWQAAILTSNPRLSVSDPQDNQEVSGVALQVIGKTDPGMEVTINGSQVFVEDDGSFTGTVTLQEGVNSIDITARNNLGRTTTITRSVLVKRQAVAESLPTDTTEGDMVVELTALESVYVTIVTDGRIAFSGTFADQQARLWHARRRMEIRTDHPDRLRVRYTTTREAAVTVTSQWSSPLIITERGIDGTAESE